jgi:hypothetical protein
VNARAVMIALQPAKKLTHYRPMTVKTLRRRRSAAKVERCEPGVLNWDEVSVGALQAFRNRIVGGLHDNVRENCRSNIFSHHRRYQPDPSKRLCRFHSARVTQPRALSNAPRRPERRQSDRRQSDLANLTDAGLSGPRLDGQAIGPGVRLRRETT